MTSSVPIAFLDTETTSLRADREVWEIGIFRREAGAEPGTEIHVQKFLPVTLQEADLRALNVGGFYERHPYGQLLSGLNRECKEAMMPWADADDTWHEVARMLHGAHVVGAVPNFDTEAISEPMRRAAVLPAHHYHLVDVENLAVGFLAGQGVPVAPPWKSDDLAAQLGLEPISESDRHTALGDAMFAMRIYDRVMSGVSLKEWAA